MNEREMSCELCGDTAELHLHGRCHPTAPLRIELNKGIMSVFCYLPTCNRLIGQFAVTPIMKVKV